MSEIAWGSTFLSIAEDAANAVGARKLAYSLYKKHWDSPNVVNLKSEAEYAAHIEKQKAEDTSTVAQKVAYRAEQAFMIGLIGGYEIVSTPIAFVADCFTNVAVDTYKGLREVATNAFDTIAPNSTLRGRYKKMLLAKNPDATKDDIKTDFRRINEYARDVETFEDMLGSHVEEYEIGIEK